MDRGVRWATGHRVVKSWTGLTYLRTQYVLSWLINHVNLDNENTLSSSSNAVFEYLALGVPQAYKVHVIPSKEINSAAHRDTGSFPKDAGSRGSVPHMCNSQMQACLVLPCCSPRYMIVL